MLSSGDDEVGGASIAEAAEEAERDQARHRCQARSVSPAALSRPAMISGKLASSIFLLLGSRLPSRRSCARRLEVRTGFTKSNTMGIAPFCVIDQGAVSIYTRRRLNWPHRTAITMSIKR